MPRTAREKSDTGIYHVMMRGVNRQSIFNEKEDNLRFLQTLSYCRDLSDYELYAYCLMGNHFHLLIKENKDTLGTIIKRIGSSYVYWYNMKYNRCGHLFQDRYKSETVEDDNYFLAVLRYIHQNPVKAGLVNYPEDYQWSSYRDYFSRSTLLGTDFALGLFGENKEEAIEQFKSFHNVMEENVFLQTNEKKKWNDSDALDLLKKIAGIMYIEDLSKKDNDFQVWLFQSLLKRDLSVRQISRITGIGKWKIAKIASGEDHH